MEFDGRLESAVAEMSEQLLVEGQPGDFVVLLRRGPVKVVTADGVGRDHVLGVAGPGDLFGELACLDGRDQSATMVALGEVQTVKVAAGSFVGLTDARPAVAREVACLLGSRLRTTHRFWVDRNVPDVALRVVRAITTVAAVVEGGTTTLNGGRGGGTADPGRASPTRRGIPGRRAAGAAPTAYPATGGDRLRPVRVPCLWCLRSYDAATTNGGAQLVKLITGYSGGSATDYRESDLTGSGRGNGITMNELASPCTVVSIDIVGSSAGSRSRQAWLDRLLGTVLDRALARSPYRDGWFRRLDGDSTTIVAGSAVPKAWMAADFVRFLRIALREGNEHAKDVSRLRIRVGIAHGETLVTPPTVSGDAVRLAARLRDCSPLRDYLSANPWDDLGLIVSDGFYREVIIQRELDLDPDEYYDVTTTIKDGQAVGWIRMFRPIAADASSTQPVVDDSASASPRTLGAPAPGTATHPVTRHNVVPTARDVVHNDFHDRVYAPDGTFGFRIGESGAR